MLKKAYKHFLTVTKHKYYVFRLSIKAGIPVRGFLHDFSNYNGSIDKSSNIKPFMTWYYCFVDNKLITK